MKTDLELLLIDDDRLTLFIHEKILSRCELPFTNKSFSTGASALVYMVAPENALKKFVLLLDINMPEMSGWELLDTLATLNFNSKGAVIMVTSSVDQEDEDKAESYECVVDFIVKPLTIASCKNILDIPEISALIDLDKN